MSLPAGCGVVAGWVPRLGSSLPSTSHQSVFFVYGLDTVGPEQLSLQHMLSGHTSRHLHVGPVCLCQNISVKITMFLKRSEAQD